MTSKDISFWTDWQYQLGVPSCGLGLKSNEKVIRFPYNLCTTIAPVGTSFLVGQYYSMQDPALRNTTDGFSPPTFYVATSWTMKANRQRGSFQVSSSLFSLCLILKCVCVFSNRVLSSSYDGQPRAMVTVCVVLSKGPLRPWPVTHSHVSHAWNRDVHLITHDIIFCDSLAL